MPILETPSSPPAPWSCRIRTASLSFAIASGAVLELNRSANLTYTVGATFSGSGTLRKTGAGYVDWGSTATTFSLGSGGLIDLAAGSMHVGQFSNKVWTSNLSDLNVASGTSLTCQESNVRVNALTGAGSINQGYSGGGYTAFTIGVDNGSGTYSGVMSDGSGAGNLVKVGTGTQTLSGASLIRAPPPSRTEP